MSSKRKQLRQLRQRRFQLAFLYEDRVMRRFFSLSKNSTSNGFTMSRADQHKLLMWINDYRKKVMDISDLLKSDT